MNKKSINIFVIITLLCTMLFSQIAFAADEIFVPSLRFVSATANSITISTTDQNSSNTYYQIAVVTNTGTKYVTYGGALISDPRWITLTDKKKTIEYLTPNTRYVILAKAKNSAGVETVFSEAIAVTTLLNPPSSVSATPTSDTVTFSWSEVSGSIGYDIELDGRIMDVGLDTTLTQTGLYPNTEHLFKVRAKNVTGPSEWSYPLTVKTLDGTPPFTIVAVNADKPSPQRVGNTVNFTVITSGATDLLYKFEVSNGSGWTSVQDFSASNTFSWTPTQAGQYYIFTSVKQAGSSYAVMGPTINYTINP